jgi:hypothetical protein
VICSKLGLTSWPIQIGPKPAGVDH